MFEVKSRHVPSSGENLMLSPSALLPSLTVSNLELITEGEANPKSTVTNTELPPPHFVVSEISEPQSALELCTNCVRYLYTKSACTLISQM